ncbi:MAG: cysteine hydrolase [Caulobacterales bacterium]|nr:cysteine hydrolase [Caulobacterales bacterium]
MRGSFHPPLLVCLDFQREFEAAGRPLSACVSSDYWRRARNMLAFARDNHWLIAHAFLHREENLFGQGSDFARPVSGFEPRPEEMIFVRSGFSAYGNSDFAKLVSRNVRGRTFVMGPGGPASILATAFSAFDHHHTLILLEDLIGCLSICGADCDVMSEATTALWRSLHEFAASDLVVSELAHTAPGAGDAPIRELPGSTEYVRRVSYRR